MTKPIKDDWKLTIGDGGSAGIRPMDGDIDGGSDQ